MNLVSKTPERHLGVDMKDTDKEFFTAQEISEFLVVPLNTIYRLTKSGGIKAIKIGRQWRYLKDDIVKLLETKVMPIKNNQEKEERREYPRINSNLHCEYKIDIPQIKHFYSITGNIRNISACGVLLYDTSENLKHVSIGDPIELYFNLPTRTGGVNIVAQGRVVRKNGNKAAIEELGIKFRNLNKYYQSEILNYVD